VLTPPRPIDADWTGPDLTTLLATDPARLDRIDSILGGEVDVDLDDVIAMSLVDDPAKAITAIEWVACTRDEDQRDPRHPTRRVQRLVDIVGRFDAAAAVGVVEAVNWAGVESRATGDLLRSAALARVVAHLASSDWEAALDRAGGIVDRLYLRDALAAVAASIPDEWPPAERGRALQRVLDIAAERLASFVEFPEKLTTGLRASGTVDSAMQVRLLADTARWSTDRGVWSLGRAAAAIAADPEGLSESVDGLLAAVADLPTADPPASAKEPSRREPN
jgi:hypothetical protein